MVVEDAAVGIEAAIVAGMWTIGLGSSDRFKTADVILPNLIGVHLTDLQTKLDQMKKFFHFAYSTNILFWCIIKQSTKT